MNNAGAGAIVRATERGSWGEHAQQLDWTTNRGATPRSMGARMPLVTFRALRVVCVVGLVLTPLGAGADPSQSLPELERGVGAGGVAFIDSAVCADCHQAEFEAWSRSHHAKSMEPASADTVRADFDDVQFEQDGVSARFLQRDGGYFAELDDLDGARREVEIAYTFGYEPLQQYLARLPAGVLQALPIAWDTQRERWFYLTPGLPAAPGDPLHWAGRFNNWNTRCAECHSTDLRKNYDAETRSYQTRFSEVNVNCQACHGPGAEHVAWATGGRDAPVDYGIASRWGAGPDGAMSPAQTDAVTCARCHSRRTEIAEHDLHGAPFHDQFLISTLDAGLYHADGQIDDEVFVYGSSWQEQEQEQAARTTVPPPSGCRDTVGEVVTAPFVRGREEVGERPVIRRCRTNQTRHI